MANIFDLFKQISTNSDASAGAPEFIIAGLGNPGEKYTFTRHNAGFLALDYISQARGVEIKQIKFKSLIGFDTIAGKRVLLMKPQTFMNASGEAVREAASFYNIAPENIIVLCDDICQSPGRMRIRKSGSDGGQKGLRSIIEQLSSDNFCRVRIGVGEKPHPEYPLADWVLGKIPDGDKEKIFEILKLCDEALPLLVEKKYDDAMGKYNGIKF